MPENDETNKGTATDTNVTTVDVESMEDILGIPGASTAMLPETEKKPSMFSRETTDTSFLDKDDEEEDSNKPSDTTKAAALLDSLVQQNGTEDDQEEAKTSNAGRPKTDKSALLDFTKKWIEEGKLKPFTNDAGEEEDITKYSVKDFEELFEANLSAKEVNGKKSAYGDFYENLPREIQYLIDHVSSGNQDIKGALKNLARSEERRSLSVDDEGDQEKIARIYLRHTTSFDEEDINDQINDMKDRGELAAKAAKYKPKLDQIEQQILAEDLQKQQDLREQQQAMAAQYRESVFEAIEPGELNGIKLDKKTQGTLYAGLVQPNYPSISGKATNLLGHLLEKYQFVEPNHGLIAEALWLLSDPDGYRSKVKEGAKKEATEKTVRMLKDEERNKNTSGSSNNDDDDSRRAPSKQEGLKRNNNNFFKRG